VASNRPRPATATQGWPLLRGLVVLFTLATGCTGAPCGDGRCVEVSPPEGADAATALVWRDIYDEPGRAPLVTWLAVGDCATGLLTSTQLCVAGLYRGNLDAAWVLTDSREADRWTILAHELLHAHLMRLGDLDPEHRRPEWGREVFGAALDALRDHGFTPGP
jgi:hypothetical protein